LRLKILKKLRTAILNSEFTGSYKKSVVLVFHYDHWCPVRLIDVSVFVYLKTERECQRYK